MLLQSLFAFWDEVNWSWKVFKSFLAALTLAVNCWIIEIKLATALFALSCLLKAAFLLISSIVGDLASLDGTYGAWALLITLGTILGVAGFPVGLPGVGNLPPLGGRTLEPVGSPG